MKAENQQPTNDNEATTMQLFDELVSAVGEGLEAAIPVILPGASTELALRMVRIAHSTLLAQRRHAERSIVKAAFAAEGHKQKTKRRFPTDPRAATAKRSLMDLWKIGSVPLRDATRDALIAEAERDHRSGSGLVKNSQFYFKLAERLPNNKSVGDILDAEEFMRIGAEVFGGTEELSRHAGIRA